MNKAAKDDPGHFQVVLDQSFDLNGSDFTPLLTQVKAANADAFLSDAHLPDFITMHRQYTQLGLKHKFVSYGARGPDQKGREALGRRRTTWWPAVVDARPHRRGQQEVYGDLEGQVQRHARIGSRRSATTRRGSFAGITKAGTLNGDKVRDALAGLEFTGALVPGNKISFDATGKPKTSFL